jgi:hypothetical protein
MGSVGDTAAPAFVRKPQLRQEDEGNRLIFECKLSGKHIHCKENANYVFLFRELRGLSPNFHIHVSVRDLYIPRIGPHISLQQKNIDLSGNI